MEVFLIGVITVITFLSRFVNLLAVPIFTDEAIYIRWAQIGLADPAHRYISLTDGKQPLLTWLMYPFLTIFRDPLFAGRLVSVLAGIVSVLGIYFVARELFGKKTAIFSSLLYIISPFFMVYDRLALMDSLLAAFGIWSLYLEILLIRNPRLDTALILGMVIGGGMLTKSSAQFFLYLLPFSFLLFRLGKSKKTWQKIFSWMSFGLISFIIAEVMYNSLRLSPWFYIIEQKNHVFILSFSEFFAKPFVTFLPNLYGLTSMLLDYLTWPVVILIIGSVAFGIIKKDRRVIYLFFWFLFPFLALAVFGRVLFPRFMLFMASPLLIIAADLLSGLTDFSWQKMKGLLVLIPLTIFYSLFQFFILIISPLEAAIPKIDRNQLFDDWPSGTGVTEVISYLKNEAEDKKIVVGTEGTFGLNPAVYEIYLGLNKNVEIYGFWPVGKVPEILLSKAKLYPTYLIFKESQKIPSDWPLTLVNKYKRGKGNTYLLFYKVNSQQL